MKERDGGSGRFTETHGGAYRPEYQVWANAIDRCENPGSAQWSRYGARGVKVCAAWRTDFAKFLSDMGTRPGDRYSLDRIDVNGDYEPGNCRWATAKEQALNRRNTRVLTIEGRRQPLEAWAREVGLPLNTVRKRFERGWPAEQIISRRRRA